VSLPDGLSWAVFLVAGPILWVAGVRLFLRSGLTRERKILWAVFLVLLGGGIGFWMPLPSIRSRFLLLLAVLPVLAFLDTRLASSRRGFLFWFRACAFEVCTVFGSAALVRLGIDLIRRDKWPGI
jgi:hypothetical protein